MSELVRARFDGVEKNVSRGLAERHGLEILDEPTHRGGRPRPTTRVGGRPTKPKTSVAEAAAKKKAPAVDASTPEEAQQ